MKFKYSLLYLPLAIACLSSCGSTAPTSSSISFAKENYDVHSGDFVTVSESVSGVTYSFAGTVPNNVSLDSSTGKITFTSETPNYSQALYKATLGQNTCSSVLTFINHIETPTIAFSSPIDYVTDGDYILTTINNPKLSIKYRLKQPINGINIDSSSGRVTYTSASIEGQKFTVVISSHGATAEREFTVAKNNLAKSENDAQIVEKDGNPGSFYLNFDDVDSSFEKKVIGLLKGNTLLKNDYFEYNSLSKQLIISNSIKEELIPGENVIGIITPRNVINVKLVMVTKLIRTPEDLASINNDRDTLQGYYMLGNDIDLTDYLSEGGAGYNDGHGWIPIGTYHDVTDGTALYYAFNGTFDGNGHVIRGFNYSKPDLSGFNCGLFGYVNNLAVIKNVGLIGSGTSRARSFLGGFVGVNAGLIQNCWADVDVTNDTGDKVFRMCGGFVGRNLGTIENCFALGKVTGEFLSGAFAGTNDLNSKLINCFASKDNCPYYADDKEVEGYYFFATENAMKQYDYSSILDSTYWDTTVGTLPTLKIYLKSYFIDSLEITNTDLEYTKGDSITVSAQIYPSELHDQYIGNVYYECDDPTVTFTGNKATTTAESNNTITITAKLEIENKIFTTSKEFTLLDKPTDIEFINDLPEYLEPGKRYKLNANVLPETASQKITWSLPSKVAGVSISGDILTITEQVYHYSNPTFKVRAKSGTVKRDIIMSLRMPKYLVCGLQALYLDSEANSVTFTFPSSVDLTGVKVYRFNKSIEAEIREHEVEIDASYLKQLEDNTVTFVFRLANGDYYRGYGVYYSHSHITEQSLTNYITISSVADFKTYFNVSDWSFDRYQYYDKKFVLTADLDFNNEALYSIGATYNDVEYYFTGEFYGMGHKLMNMQINENEEYFNLPDGDKTSAYRSSKYVVGLFSHFGGKIYDVILDNVKVNANNYCGVLAGVGDEGAVVENIKFTNCTVANIEGADYSAYSGLWTGRVLGRNSGATLVGCIFDNQNINMVG